MLDIDYCPKCKRPFVTTEVAGGTQTFRELEPVNCPHEGCDGTFNRKTGGWWRTRELTQKELAELDDGK